MKIGFTGTRSGMSDRQKENLTKYLKIARNHSCNYPSPDLISIDGGCVGADYEFHQISKSLGYTSICYPGYSQKDPNNLSCRADLSNYDKIEKENTFFARNRKIVEDCDLLIGAPYDNSQNGGTWYTIHYAKKIGKKFIILER